MCLFCLTAFHVFYFCETYTAVDVSWLGQKVAPRPSALSQTGDLCDPGFSIGARHLGCGTAICLLALARHTPLGARGFFIAPPTVTFGGSKSTLRKQSQTADRFLAPELRSPRRRHLLRGQNSRATIDNRPRPLARSFLGLGE